VLVFVLVLVARMTRASNEREPLLATAESLFYLRPVPVGPLQSLGVLISQLSRRLVLWVTKCWRRCCGEVAVIAPYANDVVQAAEKEREIEFDEKTPAHAGLLLRLWVALKPGMEPPGSGGDYGDLGFQNGLKPGTDFRGMGLLSLEQLVWFAEKRGRDAREVLLFSCHPTRYYPFAATGVNITQLCLGLLREGRLDRILSSNCGNDDNGVNGDKLSKFHSVFAELFVRFSELWETEKPENVLAFPTIFRRYGQNVSVRNTPGD
jgi:hypothetical protein